MQSLLHQRCFNHGEREAVARCPECRQFYCRECITEHDDRVICANSLRKLTMSAKPERKYFNWLMPVLQSNIGLMVLWAMFYFIGATMLSNPSLFHEVTILASNS